MAELTTDITRQHEEDTVTPSADPSFASSDNERDDQDTEQTDVPNGGRGTEGHTESIGAVGPEGLEGEELANKKKPPETPQDKEENDQGEGCNDSSSDNKNPNSGSGGDSGRGTEGHTESIGAVGPEGLEGEELANKKKPPETPQDKEENDQGEGCNDSSSDNKNPNSGAGGDGGKDQEILESSLKFGSVTQRIQPTAREDAENLGGEEPAETKISTTRDKRKDDQVDGCNDASSVNEIPNTGSGGRSIKPSVIAVALVVVVAILVQHLLQPESPPQKNNVRQVDIFIRKMEKVKTQFPNQRAELWKRSGIHLQRHLVMAQPTEPVSLILTASRRAERTLHCLAQGLASAFSSALNASVLHIDGASKASQDSDQVKLDIDRKLQGAFEGDKPAAVIHRLEELPPGSTLIFYRYCDHENAAYKNIFLVFTVLLGDEEEIPAKIQLSAVEEMVDDHLKKKFLSHEYPVSFDRMDLDKYGGLWSRISHLILPVAAEERIEHEGCQDT